MATFNKFNNFVQQLGLATMNLNTDSLKIALTNTAPVATNSVLTDLTQITAANGYAAGGTAVGSTAYANASGTSTLSGANVVFTAAGGTMGPLRYASIYDATEASHHLIGFWDYGSSITLNDTETLTVNLSSNILTIA